MVTLAAFCGTLGSYSLRDFNKEPIRELTGKCHHRDMHDMAIQTMVLGKMLEE